MQHVLKFIKMHALGNDILIVDRLTQAFFIEQGVIKNLAHRKTGIGFDQLIILEPPIDLNHDFHYQAYNSEGTIALAPSFNGVRALTHYIVDHHLLKKKEMIFQTNNQIVTTETLSHSVSKVSGFFDHSQQARYLGSTEYFQQVADEVSLFHEKHLIFWNCSKEIKKHILNQIKISEKLSYATCSFATLESEKNISLETLEIGFGRSLSHGGAAIAAAISCRAKYSQSITNFRVITQTGYVSVMFDQHHQISLIGPTSRVYRGECLLKGHQ